MMLVKNIQKLVKKSNNNIIMRTFIIFFNFLLITLILYTVLTSKTIEGLSGCSSSEGNAIYRQQALINRLFSELNTTKAEYNQLNSQSAMNKILIQANSGKMKSTTAKVEEGRKEKEKELDDLDKKNDSGPTASLTPLPTQATGANNFGGAMKGSASSF